MDLFQGFIPVDIMRSSKAGAEETEMDALHSSIRLPSNLAATRKRGRRRCTKLSVGAAAAAETAEIRVCVNRSCSRQGSRSILDLLSGLAPPNISVSSCGCLGRCGAGPNLVVLPHGSVIGHCSTSARAARILNGIYGPGFDPQRNLQALALRKKAEDELDKGNFEEAEALISQAIELEPSGGLHFMYRCRAAARLGRGDNEGALEDGEEACRIAPKFPQAHICKGDAFLAMEEWDAAEKAYSNALLIDPSIRRSKSFKARVAKLQEKLIVSHASS